MIAWRRVTRFLADRLDSLREPGWPRRIAIVVVVGLVLLIPYPLSITGDFEVISMKPMVVRSQVEGPLTEILVKMGDHVEAGQVVARLLDVELKLERARVLAQLREVEASLRLTREGYRKEEIQIARLRVEGLAADVALRAANLAREAALFQAGDIPRARLDDATNAHVQAKASLDQATQELHKLTAGFREEEIAQAVARVEQLKGQLATTEQHLAWIELKAPMAGQVVTPDPELQQRLGTVLARGAPVLDLVAPGDLVARVEVPESEFGDVSLGEPADLRSFQYPGTTLSGKVEAIERQVAQLNEFSSVVPVLVRVVDPGWSLLRIHTRGRAKLALGYTSLGRVLYRRFLRSTFVKLWSWY
ncbi:MAG TPA: HlyD family efflux transporter periplasmic adaptor subunit [Kofleriaceae bacterium]